jgi:hypothetical protein
MKRRIVVILACLLIGAVANVAVAWSAVLAWKAPRLAYAAASDEDDAWWEALAPEVITGKPKLRVVFGARGARYITLMGPSSEIKGFTVTTTRRTFGMSCDGSVDYGSIRWDHALRAQAGWPMVSLEGERWYPRLVECFTGLPGSLIAAQGRPAAHSANFLVRQVYRPAMLPLRPVLPGFAVNALLYAAVVLALVAAPAALRRRLRVRAGRCPACGYPASPSPACSECGRAHPSRPGMIASTTGADPCDGSLAASAFSSRSSAWRA